MVDITQKQVRANGIEIHYVEAGDGPPLLLLHGGVVSANPSWGEHPFAYASHLPTFAKHFRVIAPDTRAAGRTAHPGGPITYDLLADDVLALIGALELDRPMIAGFSEGGLTATIVGLRAPGAVRAIVNHAGHDMLNPEAPSFGMLRAMLGGSPTATAFDPVAAERAFGSSDQMRATFEAMKADHGGGAPGYWQQYLGLAFERLTRPPGYTMDDLRRIAVPMLLLFGDRDDFCSVEEGTRAFRKLPGGELAVLAGVGHFITASGVQSTVDFLCRTGSLRA